MDKRRPKKIVVCVDGDKEACEYLAACLNNGLCGHVISIPFTSPSEALKYLETNKADLVTSCIQYEGMDGFEFLKRFKAQYPNVPFLIIAADGDIETFLTAMNAGADDFFVKPLFLPELYKVITRTTGLRLALSESNEAKPPPVRNKVVILAEGDHHVLMGVCILLERMGFDAVPAEDGLEVMGLLRVMTPDAVLLDVNLPKLDGMETLKQIKNDARHGGVPVVMLSANPSKEMVEEGKAIGCSGFLEKPVSVLELSAVMERCLFPQRGRRHARADINIKVAVSRKGISQQLYTKNLSERGIYVRTKSPFPPGTEVEVVLPVGGGKMMLSGSVIHTNPAQEGAVSFDPGMAIEFSNVPPNDSAQLKIFVSKLIAHGVDL